MPEVIISQFDRTYAMPIETNRQVQTITDRNNIPSNRRWEGMQVYVVTENKTYELNGGVNNSNWEYIANLGVDIEWGDITGTLSDQTDLNSALNGKQDTLVSATNIKTINGNSILGGGNLVVSATVADGDKGDITVSGGGNAWNIDTNAVSLNKIQNISTARFLGRITSGTGFVESLTAAQMRTGLSVYSQSQIDSSLSGKENTFSKNTGFNKNFGTSAGTVSEGNHTHTFASLTSKPTTIGGYGITDFNSLGDARWLGLGAKAADSNLFDGIDSDRFLIDRNINITTGDWNSQTPNTIFAVANASGANKPSGAYGYGVLTHLRGGVNDSQAQIYYPDDNNDGIYFRTKYGGNNWKSWREVWTNANDGSGSGLDADLLDGVQGTNYARTDIAETFSNTVTATNFILSSDRKLKNNIKQISKSIYQFEMKDNPGILRYGVIADEVEKSNADLVTESENIKRVMLIDYLALKLAELENKVYGSTKH